MAHKHHHVLVLDANQRSALAVTRSLGRVSHVSVSTGDATTAALAGSSRFSRHYFQHPSPKEEPARFLDWLQNTIQAEHIDAVFPTTEITIQLILLNRHVLGSCLFPFTDYDTVISLAHKGRLVKLAESAGVATPSSRHFERASEVHLDSITTYPVVVKPCLSRILTDTRWIETAVVVAHSREALADTLATTDYLQNNPFMLQSFIPGSGAGVFALYNKGKPVTFFAHRRLREKPPQGGVSVFCESAVADPKLLEMAKKLLDAANWHGVAMVEFRVDPQGGAYLMEVNTRFWGSLQLAIDAGVDFPKLLWEISNDLPVSPPEAYKVGQRLRWLLGDLDSLYLTLRGSDYSAKEKLRRLAAFFIPDPFGTRHEVNRLSDLVPAWTELKSYISALRR